MKEIILSNAQSGVLFQEAPRMKIDVGDAFYVEVSNKGEVTVCDWEGREIAKLEETSRTFGRVQLSYSQPSVSIGFQIWEEIDYYPHCDGEYDRYEYKWSTEYMVEFDENTKQLKVKE